MDAAEMIETIDNDLSDLEADSRRVISIQNFRKYLADLKKDASESNNEYLARFRAQHDSALAAR